MTVGRAPGVQSKAHMQNLVAYLDDERVIERWGVHITNPDKWSERCEATREVFGHNKAAAAGSGDGKSFVRGYHLILAFNPDECAMDGPATKEQPISQVMAMEYAHEYITRFYPNQQAVITLHNEGGRWATHCFVNRTNLETGNRYHTTINEKFKIARQVRELDAEWGLKALEPGRKNTKQPAQAGRRLSKKAKEEMHERGVVLHSDVCREKVLSALSGATTKKQFFKNCEKAGVAHKIGTKGQIQFRDTEYRDEKGRGKSFTNGSNLGGGCSLEEITQSLRLNLELKKAADAVAAEKAAAEKAAAEKAAAEKAAAEKAAKQAAAKKPKKPTQRAADPRKQKAEILAQKQGSESRSKAANAAEPINDITTETVPSGQDSVDVLDLFKAELSKMEEPNNENTRGHDAGGTTAARADVIKRIGKLEAELRQERSRTEDIEATVGQLEQSITDRKNYLYGERRIQRSPEYEEAALEKLTGQLREMGSRLAEAIRNVRERIVEIRAERQQPAPVEQVATPTIAEVSKLMDNVGDATADHASIKAKITNLSSKLQSLGDTVLIAEGAVTTADVQLKKTPTGILHRKEHQAAEAALQTAQDKLAAAIKNRDEISDEITPQLTELRGELLKCETAGQQAEGAYNAALAAIPDADLAEFGSALMDYRESIGKTVSLAERADVTADILRVTNERRNLEGRERGRENNQGYSH